MAYDNRNSFTLFKNEKKASEKHADYTGTFTDADGNEFYVNGWIRSSKDGSKKFIGGNMKPKKDVPKSNGNLRDELNDDVPF